MKDVRKDPELAELYMKGFEEGVSKHIVHQQISRRTFVASMAGLGALAATLSLPWVNSTEVSKEIEKMTKNVRAQRTVYASTPPPAPYTAGKGTMPYTVVTTPQRFNYDLRNGPEFSPFATDPTTLQGQYYAANPAVLQKAEENMGLIPTKLANNVEGYTWQAQALETGAGLFFDSSTTIAKAIYGGAAVPNTYVGTDEGPWLPVQGGSLVPGSKWQGSTAEAAHKAKKAARFLGADLVGITRLNQSWIYSQRSGLQIEFQDVTAPAVTLTNGTPSALVIPSSVNNAIVMAFEEDYGVMRSRSSDHFSTWLTLSGVARCYSNQMFVSNMVAEYIRALGYNAIPCGNDTGLSIPLSIDAGLSEGGRHGLGITPEFGPQVRWAKVLTDLPMDEDPWMTFGVKEFCDVCKYCANTCPTLSIPLGDMASTAPAEYYSQDGVLKWRVNHTQCNFGQFAGGCFCTLCQQNCPWGRGPSSFHSVARWTAKNASGLDSAFVWLDQNMGYEDSVTESYWWDNIPVEWKHGTRIFRTPERPEHEE